MNHYEARQEAKRQRLERAAEKARAESEAAFKRSRSLTEGIPFGQPILVGHHSEKRHRNAVEKSWNALGRGVEAGKRAEELERRAAAVGTGGISGENPEAVRLLKEQLEELEGRREIMKRMNAHFKKLKSFEGMEAFAPREMIAEAENTMRIWNGVYSSPWPSYSLTNLGANIRRVKGRIQQLEKQAAELAAIESGERPAPEPIEIHGITVTPNLEENRVELRFPARLSKEHYKMVRSYGFVWSPTRSAFVRRYSAGAMHAAESVATYICNHTPTKESNA
jgi:hypothetical protein